MVISKIAELLNATVLTGQHLLDKEVNSACASDMMSDVLAYVKDQAALITGLCNPQVIRTAEMMDMHCIIYVRNKTPDADSIELAKKKDIVLLSSPKRMYIACGILYSNGLIGGDVNV